MTRILLLTSLLFTAFYVSGQDNRTIENLKELLDDEPHDTVKIRLLNSLAIEYGLNDTSESKYMLEKALMLAKEQEYSLGIGLTYKTHGKLHFRLGQFNAAIDKYKKAQAQFLLSGEEVKLASVTVDEGNAHLFLSDYDKALNRYNRALAVFERYDNVTGKIRCLNNMGIIYKNYGEYNNALNTYNQVIMLSEQLQDTVSLADTYINMGVVFVHLSSYHRALEHFNKALILAESFGNLKQQTMALMNSGVIHNKLENYSRAYHYYEAALEISRKLKDKVEISKCLSNIGTNYISQGKYKLADDYIREGLAIKQELGDKSSIANGYNFLAQIGYHRENYEEAIELDKKAMVIKREVNDLAGLTRCFSNISRTYIANNQFTQAEAYADSAILYAARTGSIEHTSTAYYVKMKVAEKKQAYKDAYHFAELYKQYSDSLLNENKIKAVNNVELQYEAEFLSIENSSLKMQAQLDEEIIKRQRKINLAVIIVIALIFVLLMFFVYYQKKRSQHYESIQKKNQIITKQNLRLDSLNDTKNTILSVITHDLKGSIGNQLTALSVLGSEEFRNEEERKLVFSRLANSARLSLELLENL
ncbi:MAG TPA: tetratricopeptide repeat protein, partial [Bacteroidales bacterium]|nr:tetratricopeptide repeat protein [Bacteroidales bacterium]